MANTRYVTVNGKWRLTLREANALRRLLDFAIADFQGVSDDDKAQQFGSVGLFNSAINAITKLDGWIRYTDELETVAQYNREHGTRHTTTSARALMRGELRTSCFTGDKDNG